MTKRMTRQERDQQHREAVADEKMFLREVMNQGEHIYIDEWWRKHERQGNYAAADALYELADEIHEHNHSLERRGGTRARINDHLDEVRAEERERAERIGQERGRKLVEQYRRNIPAPNIRNLRREGSAYAQDDPEEFNPGLQAPTGPRRAQQIRRQRGQGRPPHV